MIKRRPSPKAFVFGKGKKKAGTVKSGASGSLTRPSWEGVVLFGEVQIPMVMHPATEDKHASLVLLDKKDMNPVGNRPYNKVTDANVSKDDVVKGAQGTGGKFVIVEKDDLALALPRTLQTLKIECVVNPLEISPAYYLKAYYLRPQIGADKAYAVLRDALRATRLAGVGRVVVSTRQHTALVVAEGQGLTLHLLRSAAEVRPLDVRSGPISGAIEAPVAVSELAVAKRLIKAMAKPWSPGAFTDELGVKIGKLAAAKQAAPGKPVAVLPGEALPARSEMTDLQELLKSSLKAIAPSRPRSTTMNTKKLAEDKPPRPKRRSVVATAKEAKNE